MPDVILNPSNPNDEGSNGTDDVVVTAFSDLKDVTISEENITLLTGANATGLDAEGNLVDDKGAVIITSDGFDVNDFSKLSTDDLKAKYFDTSDPDPTNINIGGTDYELDSDGNALNKDGSQFKSADEIKALISDTDDDPPTSILIDDVEYTLNADGAAVTADGSVKYTADQIKEFQQVDTGTNIPIEAIAKLDGYTPMDEKGNPLDFDATPEGIAKRTQAIVETEAVKLAQNHFTNMIQQDPELHNAIEYKRIHGTMKGFDEFENFETLKVKDDDKDTYRRIIKLAEIRRGRNISDAEDYVKYVETSDKLNAAGAESLGYLASLQKTDRETAEKKQADDYKNYTDRLDAFHANVREVVDGGTISGFNLPENFNIPNGDGSTTRIPRSVFYDYVTSPVKDGYTQAQLDRIDRNTNLEDALFDDLMLFLKGSTSQLVKNEATSQNIQKLITSAKRQNVPSNKPKVTLRTNVPAYKKVKL